jgi:tricorn protease
MTSDPDYAAYVINLRKEDPSPFELRSDEEEASKEENKEVEEDENDKKDKKKKKKEDKEEEEKSESSEVMKIDFRDIGRRTIALPVPERNYRFMVGGPEGAVFIAENVPNKGGYTLHKFTLKERKAEEFVSGIRGAVISQDGKSLLTQQGVSWKVMNAEGSGKNGTKTLKVNLQMKLDRSEEWKQMFDEAWRYERDYFYDPGLHGRDWDVVYQRYAPLVPYVKHRADLTYILDQMNGELSVGHSFVFGGDYPDTESSKVGLLGADLVAENGRWKIERIYTTESWNPDLTSPLDRPGINIREGYYLVGINGEELTSRENPFKMLDGTLNKQTIVHINKEPEFEGSWKETVKPIGNENALRQRAWVEDNRRRVDSLSGGRLAYVWVPNTGGQGLVSFNRYFFAQQDKEGAIIDERFNGGGLLDDYMVDLMTRKIRAAYTNEVPDGKPGILPAGILGPKVLLINEMAGSGGDFFPWVFRQQNAGPLIGARTWGGLVKSSVHYSLIDGGALTAPDNAIFDPVKGEWIGENVGIPPDIPVRQDAKALAGGKDPQLERAVEEALKMLEQEDMNVKVPEFPEPAKGE